MVPAVAGRITVGRDPASTLAFDPLVDVAVSTRHAEITLGPDGRLRGGPAPRHGAALTPSPRAGPPPPPRPRAPPAPPPSPPRRSRGRRPRKRRRRRP